MAGRKRIAVGLLAGALLSGGWSEPPAPYTAEELSSARITLERGGCYGPCPSYSVEIRGDGGVVYQGGAFTAVQGERRAQVRPEAVAALAERFRRAGFFSLKDAYVSKITDQPTFTLSFSIGGRTKKVTDYAGRKVGMPPVVTELENAVDEVAGTARWVRKADGPAR